MSRIFLSPPFMGGEEQKYIQEAFDTNWIAPLGPNVTGFEKEMGEYLNIAHPLALVSGSAAIHLSLKYLGVSSGDIVFCSSFTFSGSCNAILYEHATPVFIDSEPDSWNMSPVALEKAFANAQCVGKLPKAVIIVDLYGNSADWDTLLPICASYGVPIIEDAAEALGTKYKGEYCGSFGDIGIISFNGNKIITTSGGGMALCRNEEQYKKMLFWATQSKEPFLHYEHREVGYNYRLSNICAGIGRGQLKILDSKLARRKEIFKYYKKCFEGTPIHVMCGTDKCESNHWLTVALIDDAIDIDPEKLCILLGSDYDIETRPAWKPMHMQPVFAQCKAYSHLPESFVCEKLYSRGICLPCGDAMTQQQLDYVVKSILDNIGA